MENRVPLPTDNIYKFYALFGLLLAIFGTGGILYVYRATNDLAFEIAVEYETLKADPARSVSQETRYQVLKRRLEIARSDRGVYLLALSVVIGVGTLLLLYGFRKWHAEVQPIQDEIARLTLIKLKREVDEDEGA